MSYARTNLSVGQVEVDGLKEPKMLVKENDEGNKRNIFLARICIVICM